MRKIIFTFFAFILNFSLYAQFYIGHQMSFGKNRIQYRNFEWRFVRYKKFDIYYYKGGNAIAHFVAKYANESLTEIEKFLDYNYKKRIVFIVYNSLTDYKQTNLGLETGNINFEITGLPTVYQNKVVVYFEGDHQKLKFQVRKSIATLVLQEMLFGRGFSRKNVKALIDLPNWFLDGLAAYIADPYWNEANNFMRDFFLNYKRHKLTFYPEVYEPYIGHNFWQFIVDNYGQEVVSNILYFVRLTKNINLAFYYVLGVKFKKLERQWVEYNLKQYNLEISKRQSFDSLLVLKKFKKNQRYYQIKYCTRNGLYAYATNDLGKIKIYIYNPETHKKKLIYKQGTKLKDIVDYSYPVLTWMPSGDKLAFITDKKGFTVLHQYDIQTGEHSQMVIPGLLKIYSANYSKTGRYIVMSGLFSNGYVDILLFNLITGNVRRLTNDPYDDLYPNFILKDQKIIFASNRGNNLSVKRIPNVKQADSLSRTFDLYILDFKNRSKPLERLTYTPYSNETQPFEYQSGKYLYLSDSVGINNRMFFTYDSIIIGIDTIVHYQLKPVNYPLTNYPTSILDHNLTKRGRTLSETKFWQNRFLLSSYPLKLQKVKSNFNPTFYKREQIAYWQKQDERKIKQLHQRQYEQKVADSIAKALQNYIPTVRDTIIDYNNYVFEIERDTLYRIYYTYLQQQRRRQKESKKWGKVTMYRPTFYLTNTSSVLDYSSIIQSYQPFTGGPFVFSSGVNVFNVIEIKELMEDYRIMAGVRFNGDFRSLEWIISFEDLRKRLDKQLLFHRNTMFQSDGFINYNYVMSKSVVNELIGALRYPFNKVASIRFTSKLSFYQQIPLYTDMHVFGQSPENSLYFSSKLEFIYDDALKLSDNLYDGIRTKIFGEYYAQIGGDSYWMSVLGFDFRYYKEIWRNMIIALRAAGSTNTGSGKLVYYLGGVDNWLTINLNPWETRPQNFYYDVNINYSNNYIFQAVATPMRGFKQNIRNGTNFLLFNAEIRAPIFRMLLGRPLSSGILNDFQIVGFFDLGSAWCGLTPLSECNSYNTYIYSNPPIRVIVDLERPPYVAGYGFGFRTKILGYFTRFDFAWGYEGGYIHPMMFYLSFAYDF